MKKYLLLFSIVLPVCCFAQFGKTNEEIKGISSLYFGMDKKECIEIINKKVEIKNEGIETSNMYIIKYISISNVLFNDCVLRFDKDDNLVSIILKLSSNNIDDIKYANSKLFILLRDKYGSYDNMDETDAAWKDSNNHGVMLSVDNKTTMTLTYIDLRYLAQNSEEL